MKKAAYHYNEQHTSKYLPDRSDTDIPQNVQIFLSLCETAISSPQFCERYDDTKEINFVEGVLDYWWQTELAEPTWEQIFRMRSPDGKLEGSPSYERFCYQQGAILGYRLREKYRPVEEGQALS